MPKDKIEKIRWTRRRQKKVCFLTHTPLPSYIQVETPQQQDTSSGNNSRKSSKKKKKESNSSPSQPPAEMKWAGGAFCNSPAPKNLPVPSFLSKPQTSPVHSQRSSSASSRKQTSVKRSESSGSIPPAISSLDDEETPSLYLLSRPNGTVTPMVRVVPLGKKTEAHIPRSLDFSGAIGDVEPPKSNGEAKKKKKKKKSTVPEATDITHLLKNMKK